MTSQEKEDIFSRLPPKLTISGEQFQPPKSDVGNFLPKRTQHYVQSRAVTFGDSFISHCCCCCCCCFGVVVVVIWCRKGERLLEESNDLDLWLSANRAGECRSSRSFLVSCRPGTRTGALRDGCFALARQPQSIRHQRERERKLHYGR